MTRTITKFDEHGKAVEVPVEATPESISEETPSNVVAITPDPPGVTESPTQLLPKCQYCNLDPCFPAVVGFQNGDVQARATFCPQCRALFGVQIVGMRRT
jgi:hypothetical protein